MRSRLGVGSYEWRVGDNAQRPTPNALHRDTGQIVWSNNKLRSGYTTLLLDGDRLIVSTNGYLYGLDPLTGEIRWENPLSGYGVGVTTMASVRGNSPAGNDAATAESEQDDDRRRSDPSDTST